VRACSQVVSDSIPWVEGVKSDLLISGSTALG